MTTNRKAAFTRIKGEWIIYSVALIAIVIGGAIRLGAFPAFTRIETGAYLFDIPLHIGPGELAEPKVRNIAGVSMSVERSWDLGLLAPGLPTLQLRRLDATEIGGIVFSGAALSERAGEPDLVYVDYKHSDATAGSRFERLTYSAIELYGRTAQPVIGSEYIFPDSKGAWVLAFRTSPKWEAAMEEVGMIIARSFQVKTEGTK